MASLNRDPQSGQYHIRFRFGGRQYKRSLKTPNKREALSVLGRVDETLRFVERGRLDMPAHADPATFVLSDGRQNGKKNGKPTHKKALTITELFTAYRDSLPEFAKEATTLEGEDVHIKHLLRHLKRSTIANSITTAEMQQYVTSRSRESWCGKLISPDTINKEIGTFRMIWNWAENQGRISGPSPTRRLKYPKRNEKPPFMTRDEIETIIARKHLKSDEQRELWESLFLTVNDIDDVLACVVKRDLSGYVFPMFVFAAHTGARRSEIFRSQIEDFDFDARLLRIREKKRSRKHAITFRNVPLTDRLHDVMTDWFCRQTLYSVSRLESSVP